VRGLTQSVFRRSACAFAVVALLALTAATADGARSAGHVRVSATASGSTLTIGVAALPRSRCLLRLGAGAEAVALPDLRVGPAGRGRVRTDLSTDAPTGEQRVVATCGRAGVVQVAKASVSISAIALHGPVATGFNIALDVLLVGALLVFAWLLVEMVIFSTETRERFLRSLALAGGAILALGAQVTGIDFAGSMVDSLVGNDAMGTGGKVLLAIAAGLVAAGFGWYFTQVALREETRGLRLGCALGAMTIVGLTLILAEAFDRQGLFLEAGAIPNFAFMVGLIGGVIFSVPAAEASAEGGGGVLTSLVGKLAKGRGHERTGGGAESSDRRNPFSGD
jgi:hypothetical protein